ncbi:MAG: SCP2 domain-containing protein [marine bacterium B5-7]|nr:MAG: SCP2 domain-containing protein [marine bacterium B5-7]
MNESSNRSTDHASEQSSPLARIMTSAIQKMIKYDASASKKLKPLAGKKVKINIQPIDQSIVLIIHADTITVSTDNAIEVDTTISGKPSALFAMSTNQHIPGLEGVTINGDASTGQFVADLLKHLRPDWEDAWCDLLGEGPGYQVSQLLKGIKQAGEGLIKSIQVSSKEYLLEENRELISPEEMEEFLNQVDDLKSDAVRLERKIAAYLQN